MYYDLFLPFPTPDAPVKKKGKGKGKAPEPERPTDCWAGLSGIERDRVARSVALAGHRECLSGIQLTPVGYTVVAHTITVDQSNNVLPCPFGTPEARLPAFPALDPRMAAGPSTGQQPSLVQVTRYHMRLDDGKVHPIVRAAAHIALSADDRRPATPSLCATTTSFRRMSVATRPSSSPAPTSRTPGPTSSRSSRCPSTSDLITSA